ncbi:hypothetical protein CDL15_Pgr019334 [Punica granatum]|uniref:Uncharacterized protein n=1 Tax=Punica granatum TaxID=22663 RepID=A0A218X670_PUNGR|nr:hypothetical protein CDL15_Pgr019334 [Punica granatum]
MLEVRTGETKEIVRKAEKRHREAYCGKRGIHRSVRPDKYGRVNGYGRWMTKSRLDGIRSFGQGSLVGTTLHTVLEEVTAKHAEQIEAIRVEQAAWEKSILEKVESRHRAKAEQREAPLLKEAEERYLKLAKKQEEKLMADADAREEKYQDFIDNLMSKLGLPRKSNIPIPVLYIF